MNLHKSLILLSTLSLVTLRSVGISPALADNPNNYRNQRQETRHRSDNNQRRDNNHRPDFRLY
jgi:hypothetical protein